MLAFENKNLWDCYFPLQPAKRILNAPDERFSNWWIRFFEGLNFDTVRTAAANMARNSFLLNTVSLDWSKLHWANLDGADFYFPRHAAAVSVCTWALVCASSSREPTWASMSFRQMDSDRPSLSVSTSGCSPGLWFRSFPTAEQKAVLCKTNQQTGNLKSVMKE